MIIMVYIKPKKASVVVITAPSVVYSKQASNMFSTYS